MDARLDEVGRDDRGGAADRAGGVHPDDRLAQRAERLGEVELRHHHALEHVGRLADDDRVDVLPVELGVGERAVGRLADEAGDRDVLAGRDVLGLPGAEHRGQLPAHACASSVQTRFCCSSGPLVACAMAVCPSPLASRVAASPMRFRPATITGLDASAPPDGLIDVRVSSRPSASIRISSCELNGACSSAMSTSGVATPAFSRGQAWSTG